MRIKIFLQCEECKRRNYTTTKSKRPGSGKIHLKKYCPHCKKHTNHKEVKI